MIRGASVFDAITTFAYVIILGFLWRMAAAHLAMSDAGLASSVGKAMAVIY